MLDDLGLVHMNGRIYDPLLGRMLSADTFVQDAGDLQAYNRYSYVRNNPTSLNDPSGHFWSALITVGFAAYDTYNYAAGKTTGAEYAKNMALNGAALIADVATAGQGGGIALRIANGGIRAAKAIDKANDTYETVNAVIETGKVVASGDSAEISRAVASALVETVVGAGKGKHELDINANAVSAKKLDGVDAKNAPTSEVQQSRGRHETAAAGAQEDLNKQGYETRREVTVNNADGTTSRVDIAAWKADNPQSVLAVEVKTGDAQLSAGQRSTAAQVTGGQPADINQTTIEKKGLAPGAQITEFTTVYDEEQRKRNK